MAENNLDGNDKVVDTSIDFQTKTLEIQRRRSDETPFLRKSFGIKIFHIVLLLACIISPLLLIGSFLYVAYSNDKSIQCCSISSALKFESAYIPLIIISITSATLACFVSLCRQIQIHVKFIELNELITIENLKNWLLFNKISVGFNIFGYLNVPLLCIVTTRIHSLMHLIFATNVFVFSGLFAYFTAILSWKQRYIEYKRNLIKYNDDGKLARHNSYFLDAIVLSLIIISSTILMLSYVFAYFYYFELADNKEGSGPDALLPAWANVCEWIAIIGLNSTLIVLAFSFHHDNVDDEMMKYYKMCCSKQ